MNNQEIQLFQIIFLYEVVTKYVYKGEKRKISLRTNSEYLRYNS